MNNHDTESRVVEQPAIGDRRSEMLDYFAAHALQGMLSVEPCSDTAEQFAMAAYQQAEAMIREREKWIK